MNTPDRPVLVVTDLYDGTADLVITELHGRGVPVVRLDPGAFPTGVTFSATAGDGIEWAGELRTTTRAADVGGIRALWYRRPSEFRFDHLDSQVATYATLHARYGLGGVFASLPGCLYVNHPFRAGDVEYKPFQLAAAIKSGFRVPRTLITSVPESARDFARQYGRVIFKPLATPTYFDENDVSKTVGVELLGPEDIDDSVAGTAHLFQAAVDKVADVRLTVIGDRVFAVRIDSGLLDWRTDYGALTYTVVDTPAEVGDALRRFLDDRDLVYGAFDFALDADGTWWFLECNPSGQFLWMEPPTGLPLTSAMADLLMKGEITGVFDYGV